MSVTCLSPIDFSQVSPLLPGAVFQITGDMAKPGAVISSTTVTDAQIGAALVTAGWTLTAPGQYTAGGSVVNTALNAAAIEANLQSHLTTIENWITANPTGSVLTAAQTLVVARMLAGLIRNCLGLNQTVGGS